MSCALPAAFEPSGPSASSASALAGGRSGPFESRIGARNGGAASTAAATAPRQSRASASTTAPGRLLFDEAGYTARDTAAASAIGSAPPTRVVFLVAKPGKPRPLAASGWSEAAPMVGVVDVGLSSSVLPPHAAATSAPHTATTARR